MTLLLADVESFLNSCFENGVTADDLAAALKLCMRDISNMGLLDGSDDTITLNLDSGGELSVGDLSFDVPEDYKHVESILLSDTVFTGAVANARLASAAIYDPLIPFPGGHEEYRRYISDSTTRGTPEYYSEYNGKIYLYPPPDKAYDVLMEFQKYDSQDEDAIEFGDEFSNAIKFGTAYFYALMKRRKEYVDIWGPQYQNEKEFRRLNKRTQPRIT